MSPRASSLRGALISSVVLLKYAVCDLNAAVGDGVAAQGNRTAVVVTPSCPAPAPCDLELNKAFGDPWLRADMGETKYFKIAATPQLQASEIVVILAYGGVEMYAKSGGETPTPDNHQWQGTHAFLRLDGWTVPPEGDEVVVMINATRVAQYRVLAGSDEDVILLEDGLPVTMRQDEGTMRYFSVAMDTSEADLLILADPYFGDPDLYVAPYFYPDDDGGHFLPTKQNFTWQSISFGGDMIQLQAEVLAELCTPDAETDEPCMYAIGVLAVSNCSYSIQVAINSEWAKPRQLLLNRGAVSYLEKDMFNYFALSVPPAPSFNPWATLMITVTPIDGSLQDVYLTTNRSREPGATDYDAKGVNWAGSVTLLFSETSRGFCQECTVYLSVFGYKAGGYSILASHGFTRLAEGLPSLGMVGGGGLTEQFYEFYNPPGDSDSIQVDVTALTGDPDLYVSVGGTTLPGPTNFLWMKGATGSDSLVIPSSDSNFCRDCSYQLGVTAVRNSTYTITAQRGHDGATLLVHGRPQAGQVSVGKMRYFLVRPDSADYNLTVWVTVTQGKVELYVARNNGSVFIDPTDTSTFNWTSKGSALSMVSIHTHGDDSSVQYVIGVYGGADTQFTVVATFDEGTTFLRANYPQTSTLAAGKHKRFSFIAHEANEGLQMIVTPFRGVVASYASTNVPPSCGLRDEASGPEGDNVQCQGWTWASTDGARNVIFVSAEELCGADNSREGEAQGASGDSPTEGRPASQAGNNSSHAEIFPDCTGRRYWAVNVFLTVVNRGTREASFTVLASPLEEHIVLLPGRRQLAETARTLPCDARQTASPENPCPIPQEPDHIIMQSLFMFRVVPESAAANMGFSLSFEPSEGSFSSSKREDEPAKVYIKSCLESLCRPPDRYPSASNADEEFEVTAAHPAVFIADAPGTAGTRALCSPDAARGESCVYYIAFVAGKGEEIPLHFAVQANTPKAMSVVTPCIGEDFLPDGVIVTEVNMVPSSGTKNYEVCARQEAEFKVSVESCRGEMDLLVCDSTCPELYPSKKENAFTYSSNGITVCSTRGLEPGAAPVCIPVEDENDDVSLVIAADSDSGTAGNVDKEEQVVGRTFFVGVAMRPGQRAEDQEHLLRLDTIGEEGVPIAAVLSATALPFASNGEVVRALVEEGEATIEWGAATLHTPKSSGVHAHEAEDRDCGDYCAYEVYAVPARLRSEYSYTQCGLESIHRRYKMDVGYLWQGAAKADGDISRATLKGLRREDHDVFVVASCDFLCLETLLRMQCSRMLGVTSAPCSTQYAVFPPARQVSSLTELTPTGENGGIDDASSRRASWRSISSSRFTVLLVAVAAGVAIFAYGNRRCVFPSREEFSGWGFGFGGSAARVGATGGGFELKDMARDQRHRSDRDEVDEFVVGGGRGGDTEAGPGYASLLPGH